MCSKYCSLTHTVLNGAREASVGSINLTRSSGEMRSLLFKISRINTLPGCSYNSCERLSRRMGGEMGGTSKL